MSEAVLFEFPYNQFLKQRLEFTVICMDEIQSKIMRVIEVEMVLAKAQWQKRVEVATEAKKPVPREPREYWVRLSQSQIIARLYMYDSAKLVKPETEDRESEEWKKYLAMKALSISKSTLVKKINSLIDKGFLLMRSKPGDEFGSPIYTLHRPNVQKALNALPIDSFSLFFLGGVSNFESGGESQILRVPVSTSETPTLNASESQSQNLGVEIDSLSDSSSDTFEDTGESAQSLRDPAQTSGTDTPPVSNVSDFLSESAKLRAFKAVASVPHPQTAHEELPVDVEDWDTNGLDSTQEMRAVKIKPQGGQDAAVHDAGNRVAGAGVPLPGHGGDASDAVHSPALPPVVCGGLPGNVARRDLGVAASTETPTATAHPPDVPLTDACSGPLSSGQDGAAPLAGVGTSPPFASASQPRASGANASNMEANATVYTMATVAPPLSVRDELPRPLSPKQERARYEAHVWQLIEDVRKERGLRPSTYGKAWKALRENQEGINALYADAVSDEDITRGYKAMLDSSDAWLRANFTMMAFFKRLQGLLDAKPATTSTTGKGKPSRTAYDGQTDLDIYGFGQNDEAQIAKFTKLGAAS